MASQRVAVIKICGQAARVVASILRKWQDNFLRGDEHADRIARQIDDFAEKLRANGHLPPIVYFTEWIDLWSMGDLLPSLGDPRAAVFAGHHFEICCHRPPVKVRASTIDGELPQEAEWLKQRLAEAEAGWSNVVADSVIVVVREPLGGLVTDNELISSLGTTPTWLAEADLADEGQ